MERFVRYFGQSVCERRPFFNFGAGAWKHPYFQNIDLSHPNYPNNRPDLVYDAFDLRPFSLENGCAKAFYFSHVNEHLPDQHNRFVLGEVLRCLEPGGTVRIVYPDLERAYDAYQRGDREFFVYDWRRRKHIMEQRKTAPMSMLLLDFFATRAQEGSPVDGNRKYSHLEWEALLSERGLEGAAETIGSQMLHEVQRQRPNVHVNWWTFGKFQKVLGELGFVNVRRSAYMGSALPPLRDPTYFDVAFPHMSGYVEAERAG